MFAKYESALQLNIIVQKHIHKVLRIPRTEAEIITSFTKYKPKSCDFLQTSFGLVDIEDSSG